MPKPLILGGGTSLQRPCAWCINAPRGIASTLTYHNFKGGWSNFLGTGSSKIISTAAISYVRCLNCNARGPLKVLGACLSDEAAAAAWNGEDLKEQIGGLFE